MPSLAPRLLRLATCSGLVFGLVGCASIEFYVQAVVGQASVLFSRREVQAIIDDPATQPELAAQLRTVSALLRYAETELTLPTGNRYRSYVEVDGVPIWNVVAAAEFELAALPRCYPIIGCAVYRGYFSKRRAEREAARLALVYDVQISGAAAYSTLGWFDDPVFSSFMSYDAAELANLIFHELAHGVIYLRDDSAFNESFAEFVGTEAALQWLAATGGDAAGFRRRLSAAAAYAAYLAQWRDTLAELYAIDVQDDAKRLLKDEAFKAMRRCYHANRQHLGDGLYDRAMAAPFNNARLALSGAYTSMVPAFERLFRSQNGDWPAFFRAVEELGELPRPQRRQRLERLLPVDTVRQQAPIQCAAASVREPCSAGPAACMAA